MNIETYNHREEDLVVAEKLLTAENARLAGTHGYTIDEFENNMHKAITEGIGKL